MKKIRYAVVGAGVIANYMARAFTEGRDSIAVALADPNLEAANKLAPTLGVTRVVADYRTLLGDPEIDAFYLATPPFLHRPMAIDVLRAGKHVCVEKPFMLTRAEVRAVMEVQRKAPHLKVTCNSSRYHDSGTARRARQLVADGALGDLYRVHYEQVTPASKPGATLAPWRDDPKLNGGGISFDWGPYDLDWLSFVLRERFRPRVVFATMANYFPLTPERVPPCLNVDGRVAAEILCDGDLTIHWERRACEHGPARHNIEFRGTRAGFDTTFLAMGEKPGIHLHSYVGTDDLKTTALPDAPPEWQDTMVFSIRDLSRAIIEDRDPSNTLADNDRIHALFDAVLESSRTRQAVTITD